MSNKIYFNLEKPELIKHSLTANEGKLDRNGVLVVTTGSRTGRSPKDRFIVKDEFTHDVVDWGVNSQPINVSVLNDLWQRAKNYLTTVDHFVNELKVGSDAKHYFAVKVFTEKAWHAVFAKNMFINSQWQAEDKSDHWTLINVPGVVLDGATDGVNSNGAVILDFTQKRILICGILYAGELKKAMFTALNYYLPTVDVLPMHCAANVDVVSNDSALFFGLSGTGKTTLSADVNRKLVGDDEHGWSSSGIFNFEGGCYAKCVNLSKVNEPVIWDAIKPGAILENVILDDNQEPDYQDISLTENTRSSYPLTHVKFREESMQANPPSAVIFLACDLYGVLPAISCLDLNQAAYYFLSGYTALVGSTEGLSAGIKTTFSTCFGAAFFPRNPNEYAQLLQKRLLETQAKVYLVNTGWHQGGYHTGGVRYSIDFTRSIVKAATDDLIDINSCEVLPGFNLRFPTSVVGVDSSLLDPRVSWSSQDLYRDNAVELINKFKENFTRFTVDASIVAAGPEVLSVEV